MSEENKVVNLEEEETGMLSEETKVVNLEEEGGVLSEVT